MGDGRGVLQPLGIAQSMWGSFQLLISLSTKLPLPGRVPGSRGLRLAGVMYCNVTLRVVTVAIYKPETQARAQSLLNAFPNLAGSNLPNVLRAAPTHIPWFVWLPYYVSWGKWRHLWCKGNNPQRRVAARGDLPRKPRRTWWIMDQPSQHPVTPLASPQVHSSSSHSLKDRNGCCHRSSGATSLPRKWDGVGWDGMVWHGIAYVANISLSL